MRLRQVQDRACQRLAREAIGFHQRDSKLQKLVPIHQSIIAAGILCMWLETDLDMVDVGGRVELTVANDAWNDRHVATRSGLAISDLNFAPPSPESFTLLVLFALIGSCYEQLDIFSSMVGVSSVICYI